MDSLLDLSCLQILSCFFLLSDGTLVPFGSRTISGCNILSAGYFIRNFS